ncbi:hypothetical protein [Dokdonella sp.]|uniref:hypothetical protein n=1 Tax=Dokdonella sp. TaxID=2291710 RepID=UPI002F42E38B
MHIPTALGDAWIVVATIELEERAARPPPMRADTNEFRFVACPISPRGYVWLDVYADFSLGAAHAARNARAALEELAASNLAGFRVVAGAQYLEPGDRMATEPRRLSTGGG